MRHGKKFNHLGRTASHRKAMLRNMAASLLMSEKKRIITTVAKAKALRVFIEPLITKSKTNTTHSRRTVFARLGNKEAVKILFGEVAAAVGDRPGGYTRILKIGPRKGDNAEMALIELVDFSEFATEKPKKKASRRRRKGKGKSSAAAPAAPVVDAVADSEDAVAEAVTNEEE
ncbi:MAG: 50S ribosomal protein L17 [Bacteroidota bacterium]